MDILDKYNLIIIYFFNSLCLKIFLMGYDHNCPIKSYSTIDEEVNIHDCPFESCDYPLATSKEQVRRRLRSWPQAQKASTTLQLPTRGATCRQGETKSVRPTSDPLPPARIHPPGFFCHVSDPSRSSCLVTCPACSNLEVMHIRNFKIMSVRPSRMYTVGLHPLEFNVSPFGPYLGKR